MYARALAFTVEPSGTTRTRHVHVAALDVDTVDSDFGGRLGLLSVDCWELAVVSCG